MLICMGYNQEYTLVSRTGLFFFFVLKLDGRKAALMGVLALFNTLDGK